MVNSKIPYRAGQPNRAMSSSGVAASKPRSRAAFNKRCWTRSA